MYKSKFAWTCCRTEPPPLPPHGVIAETALDASQLSPSNPNYKPPVPPHRNLVSPPPRIQSTENWSAEIPRKHRARGAKGQGRERRAPDAAAPPPPVDHEGNLELDEEGDEDIGLVMPSELSAAAAAVVAARRANIVGNPMFTEEEQEELMASDVGLDLNLGMDYEQILEYFDNLKESNA